MEINQRASQLLNEDRPFCYWVDVIPDEESGEYRPSIVFKDEPGHFPLDYTWGTDYEKAVLIARDRNQRILGLSKLEEDKIISSSMFPKV